MGKNSVKEEEEMFINDQTDIELYDNFNAPEEVDAEERPRRRKRSIFRTIGHGIKKGGKTILRAGKKVAPVVGGIVTGFGLGFGSAIALGSYASKKGYDTTGSDGFEDTDIIDGEATTIENVEE